MIYSYCITYQMHITNTLFVVCRCSCGSPGAKESRYCVDIDVPFDRYHDFIQCLHSTRAFSSNGESDVERMSENGPSELEP